MLYARIDDRYELHSLTTEFVGETFRIGKPFLIEREDPIAVHVIDVEMNDVEWQISFAILVYNFFNHRVGIVTPAALLIAESPKRRQRHVARQVSVAAEDLFIDGPWKK